MCDAYDVRRALKILSFSRDTSPISVSRDLCLRWRLLEKVSSMFGSFIYAIVICLCGYFSRSRWLVDLNRQPHIPTHLFQRNIYNNTDPYARRQQCGHHNSHKNTKDHNINIFIVMQTYRLTHSGIQQFHYRSNLTSPILPCPMSMPMPNGHIPWKHVTMEWMRRHVLRWGVYVPNHFHRR